MLDKTFAVSARAYNYVQFVLPTQARVIGTFQAQGGKNDIWVSIVDEVGFTNFTNGTAAQTYYNTGGYATVGKIDVVLRPGSYWMVFDNRQATFTNKVVTARLAAIW